MKTDIKKQMNFLLERVGDMALKRRAREIIEGLELKSKDKVLDLGCGDGFYLFLLSNLELDLKLVGSDFDPIALESAKRKLGDKKINFYRSDLMKKLPFSDNQFDKIVLSEVAEHLPDDVKGFREIYRVLKPGGILCLSVPNANYPFFWDPLNWFLGRAFDTHIKKGFWSGIWFNHIRLYTPKQIKSVVERAGFKVEEIKSLTFWCLPFNHYLINLVARLLWGGKLPSKLSKSMNKYEIKQKKTLLVRIMFSFINYIDQLNDIYQPKEQGVGVFLKVVKVRKD